MLCSIPNLANKVKYPVYGGNLGLMSSPHYIVYGLIDPRSGELRYVGKSCSGMKRPRRHPRRLKWDRGHCRNWVKSLMDRGLEPTIVVLDSCLSPDELSRCEMFHIAFWRMASANLTNVTAGGEGQWGMKFPLERRRKISRNGAWKKRDEALKLYASGVSTRVVASRLGVGHVTVFTWTKEAGLLRTRSEARNLREMKKAM